MSRPDEGLIHSWLDGELDAAEAARVEALVASDPGWSAAAAEARGLIAASARIVSALDDVPAGVVPKRAPAAPARVTIAATKRAPAWWAMRAAAAVVIVAGSAIVLSRSVELNGVIADKVAAPEALSDTKEQKASVDSAPPLAAEARIAQVPTPSAPPAAPATTGARVRNERDSSPQRTLSDAAVSPRQQIARDRVTQQQPLVQSQLSQQSLGAAGGGAGAAAPPARADAQRAPDSLQKKNEATGLRLQGVVTTAAGSDERRAAPSRFSAAPSPVAKAAGEQELAGVSAKAAPVIECYRETSGAIVRRVLRMSDSTATPAPPAPSPVSGVVSAMADVDTRARAIVFRVSGDSLFIAGANGAITRAMKIRCPQP